MLNKCLEFWITQRLFHDGNNLMLWLPENDAIDIHQQEEYIKFDNVMK